MINLGIYMKILLVASNIARTPYPVYPLGMAMIAAALAKAGHDVVQFDYLQSEQSLEKLDNCIKDFGPEIVGISMRNIDNVNLLNEQRYVGLVKDIVDTIKENDVKTVFAGGSAFSILPSEILSTIGADYGFVGEGETTVVDFINLAANGIYPHENIIYSKPELVGRAIPQAMYDKSILDYYLKNGNMANIQTKRGCTHKCVYCSYPVLEGSAFRCRDEKEVVDDMQRLYEDMGAKMLFITDSVFNDDEGHYIRLLEEMKRRNFSAPWTGFIKPEKLNGDIVLLMKETGLVAVEMGSDAPSDATLKGLAKSFNFDDIRHCNDMFAEHGIAVAHYFMFGCPGETKQTVEEGIQNILSLKKCASFMFMGIRILPDTGLEKIALRDRIISKDQDLLEPAYYIAPGIDPDWLENRLKEAFKDVRNCVFPPDALESSLQFLHKMGYTGLLWEKLIPQERKRRRKNESIIK